MPVSRLPTDAFPASRLLLATKPSARLRGMLFSPVSEDIMVLLPCRDVHTFGMQYALDLAFLDKRGKVVAIRRDVLPNKRVKCEQAVAVLERRAMPRELWFEEGDVLALGPYELGKSQKLDPGAVSGASRNNGPHTRRKA